MKKITLTILSLILLSCAAIGLVGCTDNGKPDSGSTHAHLFTAQVTTNEFLASKATCTESAKYYYSCACGEKGTATFKSGVPLGHKEVTDNAVAPTRTEDGLTEGSHCYECGIVLSEQKVIHATGSVGLKYVNNAVVGIGTCTDSDIIIPEYSPEGNLVTTIGNNAFAGAPMTSIHIPDTIIEIGTRAFFHCGELTEIHIPSSVTKIGKQIFDEASNLSTVYYDSSYYSSDSPFLETPYIKKVVFGGNIIPSGVLSGCTGITDIEIADSVISIGERSFSGCSGLTKVTIGSSVTVIGVSSFRNCSGLTSVTIPDSITYIDEQAFEGCSELTNIYITNLKGISRKVCK